MPTRTATRPSSRSEQSRCHLQLPISGAVGAGQAAAAHYGQERVQDAPPLEGRCGTPSRGLAAWASTTSWRTSSTVKLRTKVTRGGRPAALAMMYKLVESAQDCLREITGAHLVTLVRSGAKFENGVLVKRKEIAAA